MGVTPSTACGRSPSLEEGGLGLRRSRPTALPSIGYRGFAVAPITLRAPARRVVITSGINGRAMRAPTGDGGATDGCKCISQLQFPSPKTSLFEGGGPSADGGRSTQAVEGVFSRWKAYSFPKLKYMRQNAEPCAGLRRILLILYLIRRGQSMSLPFSGGNLRPEHKKFNKSNSPLSRPLTALKFLNIPALFFRNSLDFAACHRLQ